MTVNEQEDYKVKKNFTPENRSWIKNKNLSFHSVLCQHKLSNMNYPYVGWLHSTWHNTELCNRSERKVFKSTVLHSKYSHPVCLRTGRALLWEVPTCWGLCRDCSGPGCLVLWWQRRTRTLVELVQTQTAALQTEDSGLRCLLSQASPLPLLESE